MKFPSVKNQDKKVESKQEKKVEPTLEGWDEPNFYEDRVQVPASILAEIESQGLVHRFINMNTFKANYNRHASGWRPYSLKDKGPIAKLQGVDPNGCLVSGDLVLAVRPKSIAEKHRQHIDEKTKRQSSIQKQAAADLRREARAAGMDTKVVEGYED